MTWADALPNLLIGLREGLEAGLVVSILLAALRKTAPADDGARRPSSAPIWFGVLAAVMLAGSFAAVLTYSTDVLSSSAQEAVGGGLSVLAVGLVTAMVFWMRRTAASLARQLRGEVARAVSVGAGALALTAFLAVGREGLETTLFLWTAVRASGSTVAPLVGAGLGLAAAVLSCVLLYHQAVRINLGLFFNRTALLLIVIAAGVLSYGLGDLQDAGLLPGQRWVAFDLTAHVDPTSWWVSILSGVTELAPRMTVLQVVAWVVYLGVVVPAFLLAGRTAATPQQRDEPDAVPDRWERLLRSRPWTVAGALVVVPGLAASAVIAALPSSAAGVATAIEIGRTSCANGWTGAHSGTQTFAVTNRSGRAGEIDLRNAAGAVVGEIETIGPGTTADLPVTLGNGSYSFACLMGGARPTTSGAVQVTGARGATSAAVAPVTLADLTPPNSEYQDYARDVLAALAVDVTAIRSDLARDDLAAARTGWLRAQLEWERVGASYDSFGAAGTAVDGLPVGLAGGVDDPHFTGLHRLEYGLWHRQTARELAPVAATLAADIAVVRETLTTDDIAGDPTNLPIRAHEVLEDALRDHLSGIDDEGGGAAYAETYADTEVTTTVLTELTPLIQVRDRGLTRTLSAQLATLQRALLATRTATGWRPAPSVGVVDRQAIDGAVGAVLETLSAVPDLLEVPPTR